MRQTHSTQLCFDQVRIEDIQLDLYSRDTMPKILAALQKIYTTPSVFQKIMDLMKQFIDPDADPDQGRPGMTYWEILVLGVVRLSNNYTYDQLLEQANQHITLRQMLGKGGFLFQDIFYPYQTVYDNLRKFTPELLEKINEIVVKFAHSTLKIDHKPLITHTDSFVVKTNVHFPTDINLLLDAMRVSIRKSNRIAKALKIAGWQQWRCLFQRCRNLYFCVQNAKRSTSKDLEKQEARRLVIIEKYQAYINYCRQILAKVSSLLEKLSNTEIEKGTLSKFYQYGIKLIDQIERRAIKGEVIPHEEKIFSLFQEHTEWVVKGKAGVPVELGLRVGIVADQHGFILHHQVMVKQTDDKVAVNLIKDSKSKFANIQVASFDKGFSSKQNNQELNQIIDFVVMPKKGKLSKEDKARESQPEFIEIRHHHSAIESNINALEHCGLDRCRDHGLDGFKTYVALGVLAYNFKKLGGLLLKGKLEEEQQLRKTQKLAA